MKKHLLILAMAALTAPLAAQHLDGAYLADKNYGGEGDTVVEEVKDQMTSYGRAKAAAEAIQSGEAEGDLRAAQQLCVDTALYSWVQANYLAEMGRVAAVNGDTAQAVADYKAALAKALTAQKVDTHEERTRTKSKEQGAIIEKVIRRALKRLGVEG
jgi:hypothetical protein